jgi:outer membrane lipoprotein-sorting protein
MVRMLSLFRIAFSISLLWLIAGQTSAGGTHEALQLIDRMQDRLSQCRDYQYVMSSIERKGNREEKRSYRMFVKDERLVRIKVVEGRGKGSEAAVDAKGRVRGRKGGLLKPFAQTLKPTDDRIRSLRGTPFWEAACHNFLKELRARIGEPGTQCDLQPDREQPGHVVLTVSRNGVTRERYWIDTHGLHMVKGELFEGDLQVQEFCIRDVKQNVGLDDDFFSF